MLRAWRRRDSFEGGPYFRAWLYRIATNTCLDQLRRTSRRAPAGGSVLRGALAAALPRRRARRDRGRRRRARCRASWPARRSSWRSSPHCRRCRRASGRCVLARDVLGWSAAETAALLDMTVPAANSALQRAPGHAGRAAAVAPGRVVGGRTDRRRALRHGRVHGGPRAARRRRGRGRCCATTSASRCHPTRSASTASTWWRRRSRRRSGSRRWATGGSCPSGPTGCPRRPATCARGATRSSGRSRSTWCAGRRQGRRDHDVRAGMFDRVRPSARSSTRATRAGDRGGPG